MAPQTNDSSKNKEEMDVEKPRYRRGNLISFVGLDMLCGSLLLLRDLLLLLELLRPWERDRDRARA